MKALPMVGVVLAWGLYSSPAISQTAKQPPMNSFDSAFYSCATGGAFEVSYDSDTPKQATVTTSNNNTRYVLTRGESESQVEFAKGAVKFRPVGRSAVVEGTKVPFKDCKLKGQ